MESLHDYQSDDGDEANYKCDGAIESDERVLELDANYDSVMMEMSDDSTGPKFGREEKKETKKPISSSTSSSTSTSTSSSSSDSENGEDIKKYQRKKMVPRGVKSPSSNKKKSFDHDIKSDPKHKEGVKDKRATEIDRKRECNRESSTSRSKKSRSSKSPRRRDRPHHYRRSRSPIHKRRSSSRHRSHRSSYNKYKERDGENSQKDRSRSRSHGRSCKNASKLAILGRLGIELKVPEGSMTPQIALQKSMQEHVAKVKDVTGIALPSYYNPIAVNPSKYAEQMQKRKLLWRGGAKDSKVVAEKKEENAPSKSTPSGPASLWQGATFSQDQDGKLTAKFKRLMGIKNPEEGKEIAATITNPSEVSTGDDLIKKQEEMFSSMEMQYEVARVATHTHRGLGLGFGLHQFPR